jgi:hypothetical protein
MPSVKPSASAPADAPDRREEAIRRVKQHEKLVHDVLPNLRRRLSQSENRP